MVNAVNIQLNQFNTTVLNAAKNTVTIGPGADFVAVYDTLYKAGKQVRTLIFNFFVSPGPSPSNCLPFLTIVNGGECKNIREDELTS